MPQTLDVFRGDAFREAELSSALDKIPFAQGRIGAMKLFQPKPISTTRFWLEERSGVITLVQSVPRGAPAKLHSRPKRTARDFTLPHLILRDTIYAESLQDIRAMGSTALMSVQETVLDHLESMRRNIEATIEYHRIGALKGEILDADGTPMLNLFTEYGVSQQTHSMALSTTTTSVRTKVLEAKRKVEDELGGLNYTGMRALCSASFFDDFIDHPDVKQAWEAYQGSGSMRRDDVRRGFPYGDVVFEEYRGQWDGTPFIEDGAAYLYPEGTLGLFLEHYGPSDTIDTVNQPGRAAFARTAIDPEFARWVALEVESNPLPLVTMPRVVVKLTAA